MEKLKHDKTFWIIIAVFLVLMVIILVWGYIDNSNMAKKEEAETMMRIYGTTTPSYEQLVTEANRYRSPTKAN